LQAPQNGAEADRQQAGSYKSGAVVVRTSLGTPRRVLRVANSAICNADYSRRSQLAGDPGAKAPREDGE